MLAIICLVLAYYLADNALARIPPNVDFASKLLPEHILAHRSKTNASKLQEKNGKIYIPKNVDDALQELLVQVIDKYILTWCVVVYK